MRDPVNGMALGWIGFVLAWIPCASAQQPQGAKLDELCARISMLPADDFALRGPLSHTLFGESSLADLNVLAGLSGTQLTHLIESEDGRKQSIALFVLWNRGDTRGVLKVARRTLGREDLAVPACGMTDQGRGVPTQQSLGAYTERVLERWFGAPLHGDSGEFDRVFPGHPEFVNADEWVYPWIRRIRRAQMTGLDKEWSGLLADIRQLPEVQRAVIAALVSKDETPPSHEHCMEIMGDVRDEARGRILGGSIFLPEDPWLRNDPEGTQREFIRKSLEALLR